MSGSPDSRRLRQQGVRRTGGKEQEGRNMADRFDVGDIIKMKKPHPCGSQEWEVLRVGADFRLKCMGCGHQIMVSRKLVEKNTRQITKRT